MRVLMREAVNREGLDAQIVREARQDREEIKEMRNVLLAAEHTLSVHGRIDADTPLHERIRAIVGDATLD